MFDNGRPVIRRTEAAADITSASTNTTLHNLTTGRTGILKKIMIYNGNASTAIVTVGIDDGASGVTKKIPEIRVEAGLFITLSADELPSHEFEADIVAQSDNAGSGANAVTTSLEVWEIDGD